MPGGRKPDDRQGKIPDGADAGNAAAQLLSGGGFAPQNVYATGVALMGHIICGG